MATIAALWRAKWGMVAKVADDTRDRPRDERCAAMDLELRRAGYTIVPVSMLDEYTRTIADMREVNARLAGEVADLARRAHD